MAQVSFFVPMVMPVAAGAPVPVVDGATARTSTGHQVGRILEATGAPNGTGLEVIVELDEEGAGAAFGHDGLTGISLQPRASDVAFWEPGFVVTKEATPPKLVHPDDPLPEPTVVSMSDRAGSGLAVGLEDCPCITMCDDPGPACVHNGTLHLHMVDADATCPVHDPAPRSLA